ncbi:hypothetical protein FRC08_013361 [Ceratobasidium sp. 394]|nr:hypothetical protein FRC08_013361 [Ceratobasidium sp. 394]
MFPTSNVRNLKRRADSSDTEEAPAKQARVSVQNTHIRRLPALRRSDTQALDVNASTPVLQHLPPNTEPVPAPVDPTHHRGQEQDMGGSTDEESQDEEGAWDRRAKAHRHAALFRRPREPAPRMKPRMVAQTPSEIALLEGSDSDSDTQVKKLLPTTDGAATRFRRLEALRAARTATGNVVSGSKTRGSSSVMPKPVAQVMAPPSIASSSTSTTTTTTTTTKSKSVSRASSRTTVTTTTTVAQRVEEIDSLSSSCPTRAPRARSVKLTVAPKAPVTRPQRQNSRARQDALNAIAGSSSTTTTPAPAVQRLPTTASLASQPSAVLRRSRRILSKLAAPEIE